MSLVLSYDAAHDAVVFHSPCSSHHQIFSRPDLEDFLDWLKTERHVKQRWKEMCLEYRFVDDLLVVVRDSGGGSHQDFLVFQHREYLEQVATLEAGIRELDHQVVELMRYLDPSKTTKEVEPWTPR